MFVFTRRIQEKDNWLVTFTKRLYTPLLNFGLRFRLIVVLPMLVLFGSSLWGFSRLGSEFIPQLDEDDFAFQLTRSSSAGFSSSLDLQKQSEAVIRREFPEVKEIFSRIGTAEIATDPMNPNVADTSLILNPRDQWRKEDGKMISKECLGELMRKALLDQVPGQNILVTPPIQMRSNGIMEGARADLVCKVFGDSYDELERLAGEVRTAIASIRGGGETEFDSIGENPMIEIQPDREAMRKFNVHADELNRLVETALAGKEVGTFIEGNRRSSIVVLLAEDRRTDLDGMKRLALCTEDGGMLPLGQVAKIVLVPQPVQIAREDTQRRVSILINIRGRDTEGFVEEATNLIRETVKFPDVYYFEFGSQVKNLQETIARLRIVVPLALALIYLLIFLSFGSMRQATLILCACLSPSLAASSPCTSE